MKHVFLLSALCSFAFSTQAQMSIYELISTSSSSSHIEQIADNFALADVLQNSTGISLIVPSDEAVENYASELGLELDDFLTSSAAEEMLKYHLITEEMVVFSEWETGTWATTALGSLMTFSNNSGSSFANETEVSVQDMSADNGVVHFTNEVVMPSWTMYEWLNESSSHNYLRIALEYADLVELFELLGTKTLFAPTDAAFLNYVNENDMSIYDLLLGPDLNEFLSLHFINDDFLSAVELEMAGAVMVDSGDMMYITSGADGELFVNNAEIQSADEIVHNGMIHSISAIIEPNYFLAEAIADQGLTILDTLLQATGLLDDLNAPGETTLFAPTDAAILAFFEAEEIDLTLVLSDLEGLAEGLLYHLTSGMIASTDLEDGMTLDMASGETATVTHVGDSIYVANSLIVTPDLIADNGYLHIIDAIMFPPVIGCMDEEACNYDSEATIDDDSCYTLNVNYDVADNACVNGLDGEVWIEVDGIELGLEYYLDAMGGMEPMMADSGFFGDLGAGVYEATVVDSLGCSESWTLEIGEPDGDPLEVSASSTGDDGTGSGVGNVTITGGSEPYVVFWYVLSTMDPADPENLAAGEYLVVVQDAEGCRQSAVVLVDDTSLVSSFDQPSILTYPNPTYGPFQITHMEVGKKSIQAIHSSGRIIMEFNGIAATSMDMDLGTFAPGIYLIRIQSSAGTSMHRVILND